MAVKVGLVPLRLAERWALSEENGFSQKMA